MKMGKVNIPGMAPEQADKINEMMAKRPPVMTSTQVEKIESKKLADAISRFRPDYTKKELPGPGAMRMAPGAMKLAPGAMNGVAGRRTQSRAPAGACIASRE